MSDSIDRKNLRVTGNHKAVSAANADGSGVSSGASSGIDVSGLEATPIVVVTSAFGPKGDSLIGLTDITFDDQPAVTVGVRANGKEGLLHLSPIHGDARKSGFTDIAPGTRCELFCPVSGQLLDGVGEVEGSSDARYYALYLTPKLSRGSMVMISDLWGHNHSRIIDDFELISAWSPPDEE